MPRMLTYSESLNEALSEEMEKNSNLIIFGQDVGEQGGIWGITRGLIQSYGKGRVIESPICEPTMVGMALGASLNGVKLFIDIQRIEFLMLGMSALVNEISKFPLLTQCKDRSAVIIHSMTGALPGAGIQHSQSLESLYTHIPGLTVVLPSNAYEAKGLMKSALKSKDPILFFSHTLLSFTQSEIPEEEYDLPIFKARMVKTGNSLTVVSNSYMLYRIERLLPRISTLGIDVELIDLRCIAPIDMTTISQSVRKTGRLLVVHEPHKIGGYGQQIITSIVENDFQFLKTTPLLLGTKHQTITHDMGSYQEIMISDEQIISAISNQVA